MGFLLFILAIVLLLPLTIINIIVIIIKDRKKYNIISILNGYFLQTATDIDRFGNRNLRTLLNLTLIKSYASIAYKFGNINETISSVLGKNQLSKTLTKTGKILVWILNKIDKNHCINSINYN